MSNIEKIQINILCENPNNANTYVIFKKDKAILIDPANDIRSIKTMLKGKELLGVLLTHGHYDHFKTVNKLLKEYNIKYYMHKNAYTKLKNIDLSCARYFGCNVACEIKEEDVIFVSEGTKIKFDEFEIKCIYKPGHTDCSMVYQIEDSLFTGDFLFENGIGRCDLPTGNNLIMYRSLKEIKQFGKGLDYNIYPGHGNSTSLIKEIKTNYYLLRN